MLAWLDHLLKINIEQYGLPVIYLTMVLESVCIPIPSEVVMPFAGYLAAGGKLNMIEVTLVAALANLSGSWLAYWLGKFGGRPFIEKYGKYVFLSKRHLAIANAWFAEKGEVTVFAARMLPGVRTFISLPAGVAGMNFTRFSFFSFLGAIPWNFGLVYLGYVFTNRWNDLQFYLHRTNIIILACLGVGFALFLLRLKLKSNRY